MSNQIDLTWQDNSSNELGFKVERSLDGVAWAQIATLAPNATAYSSTGLDHDTLYYFRVRAYNDSGDSDYSNVAQATTEPAPSGAPDAPTMLAATPVSVSAIDLSWTDNASNELGSTIERSSDGIAWEEIDTVGVDVTDYSDVGLERETLYYYRVRAYNLSGASAYSNVASATTTTWTTEPYGFIYMIKSWDSTLPHAPSLDFPPGSGFNNPYMDGFLARKVHSLMQPTPNGPYDFTWLQDIVDFCVANNKIVGMQNLSGSRSPTWMWGTPVGSGPCYPLRYGGIANPDFPYCTVCWDPEWQTIWRALNEAMAAEWDGILSYIVMSGVGADSESDLIRSLDSVPDAVAAAVAFGYPNTNDGLIQAWIDGTTWNIDMMMDVWQTTKVVLTAGVPIPEGISDPDSGDALQQMYTRLATVYPGRGGCRPNNLMHGSPSSTSQSVEFLNTTSPLCIASGFQYGINQIKSIDPNPQFLDDAIVRGNNFNAHFQEFFFSDADHALAIPILIARRPQVPGL